MGYKDFIDKEFAEIIEKSKFWTEIYKNLGYTCNYSKKEPILKRIK